MVVRFLIVERDEVYQKFEIDKEWLVKVKNGLVDIIIDTEENKYFSKTWLDEEPTWHNLKPYDQK